MIIENVRLLLIGNDKIMEAIEAIIPITKTLSGGLYNIALGLKGRLVHNQNLENISGIDNGERNLIRSAILDFISEIENYINEAGKINAIYPEYLLSGRKVPFADRVKFKEILKESLQCSEAQLIFVTGKPKSGMSYLENYLIHLGRLNGIFEIIRINIPGELDDPEPFKGASLAQLLSIELNLDLNFDISEKDNFKFARFMSKFKESLTNRRRIPIIFLHDFHRMATIPEDVYRFIYKIADSFLQDFPKAVIIIAGLNPELLPNWHQILQRVCPVYELESIDEGNIRECLKSIYMHFNQDIFRIMSCEIDENTYIEGMLKKIIPDSYNIDIGTTGKAISEHLLVLNKH